VTLRKNGVTSAKKTPNQDAKKPESNK
jgi:hypothetical protein